jgi:copper chaperone
MKQYQFKTNINCSSCVAKITPVLNASEHVTNWNVDTTNPAKILTVETENGEETDFKELLQKERTEEKYQ